MDTEAESLAGALAHYKEYGRKEGRIAPDTYKQQLISSYLQPLLNEKQLKGYAVGSPYIEYDQIAQIHKGEAIIPKTFNEGLQQGDLMMGSTNGFIIELSNIKTAILEQSKYFNGIIYELKNQIRILTDSKNVQDESLIVLEKMERLA